MTGLEGRDQRHGFWDLKKPYIALRQWPGGRKLAKEFATEEEAERAALRWANQYEWCPGMVVSLCYTGDPPRLIQQWHGIDRSDLYGEI